MINEREIKDHPAKNSFLTVNSEKDKNQKPNARQEKTSTVSVQGYTVSSTVIIVLCSSLRVESSAPT
jgi:hypothetical protein